MTPVSASFAVRRRLIVRRALTVSVTAVLFAALLAVASSVIGGQLLAKIVLDARCIEVDSGQLLRATEMSRRVREIQLAPTRNAQLQEAFGLRSAFVSWSMARARLHATHVDRFDSDVSAIDARFTRDIGSVLKAVDDGSPIRPEQRRRVDADSQEYAVTGGAALEALRAQQAIDERSLQLEQRSFAIAITLVIVLVAVVLVGPTLLRAVTFLEELVREDETAKRRSTERALEALFAQSRTGVALLDEHGFIVQSNASLATILGLTEPPGPTVRITAVLPEVADFVRDGATHRTEVLILVGDGEQRWGDVTLSPVAELADGTRTSLLILEDITERRALQERLRHEALFDSLTGLENRRAVRRHLAEIVRDGRDAYVAIIDLDDFKMINDTDGHGAGDEVLIEVARRLRTIVGTNGTTGRLGGDEFVALIEAADEAATAQLLDRLVEEIARPIVTSVRVRTVTASIGAVQIATPVSEEHPDLVVDTMFRAADLALYRAKALGRNRFVLEASGNAVLHSMQSPGPADIREGLSREEFVLQYQPVVDGKTRRCVALEALVRWDRGGDALIPPGAFIGMAERSGTIIPLGAWILTQACREFAAMIAAGIPSDVDLHVNVSALQIAQGDFFETVQKALRESGMLARRLVLEVTESALVARQSAAAGGLDAVRSLGVRWCIDDFGAGYSSLAYVHALPMACMKIDRSFVSVDGAPELANAAIVSIVLQLGRILGINVIAEGVETRQQAEELVLMGCPAQQGFVFARPFAAAEARTFIASSAFTAQRMLALG